MRRTALRKLTYADVMSTVAVFLAIGGTSYAAITVTGKNVRNSSLTGADVRNESLTGADVRALRSRDVTDGSLLAQDFAPGQLPAGARGAAGAPGAAGEPGVAGRNGATSVTVRTASDTFTGPTGTRTLTSQCAAGERATGGSSTSGSTNGPDLGPTASRPSPSLTGDVPTGWQAIYSLNNSATVTVTVYAICAAP